MALDESKLDDRTIARLLAVIDAAPQDTLSVEWQGMVLQVSKGPAPAPAHPAQAPQPPAAAAPTATDATTVTAPAIGVALLPQAVRAGNPVKAGEVLCQLKVVHNLRPVTSPCDGTMDAVLVADGQLAEYAQPLFRIRPT
jgi:acetyl-CoA carboxylase biotin carboxyl carrier protein